jgi:hypothetical protein
MIPALASADAPRGAGRLKLKVEEVKPPSSACVAVQKPYQIAFP